MHVGRVLLVAVVAALAAYAAARRYVPAVGGFEAKIVSALNEGLANLLARFEGFSATPYKDQAGLWTIGFGHMIVRGDGFWHPEWRPDGVREITREEALALKASDAQDAIDAVDRCVGVQLSENQFNALVSLAYNIGSYAFCGSGVVRALNAGDMSSAADMFMAWNKITLNGELVVSAGLTARREQERLLFLT